MVIFRNQLEHFNVITAANKVPLVKYAHKIRASQMG